MKLAYVTTYDAADVRNWSGLGTYISQSLKDDEITLEYVSSLKENASPTVKAKRRLYHRLLRQVYLLERDPSVLKHYSKQVVDRLKKTNADIIFSPGTIPIAYLKCQQPIVFWTDATFAGMINFYPEFCNLSPETIRHGNQMEKAALDRCKYAIYTSDWAAKTAIELYQISPDKVKVVPFGANLHSERSFSAINDLINSRPSNSCKLLFLGVHWERKGGKTALAVTKALNEAGLRTELTIVGCQPPVDELLPDFVRVIPYINKNEPAGLALIDQLFTESHFLILPSVADCTPVVFSEANSFGVPCLSTDVGGITTIIKNNVNGKTFTVDANISEYCTYISDLFSDYAKYRELSLSAFHEYESRLNWKIAGQTVRNLLKDCL